MELKPKIHSKTNRKKPSNPQFHTFISNNYFRNSLHNKILTFKRIKVKLKSSNLSQGLLNFLDVDGPACFFPLSGLAPFYLASTSITSYSLTTDVINAGHGTGMINPPGRAIIPISSEGTQVSYIGTVYWGLSINLNGEVLESPITWFCISTLCVSAYDLHNPFIRFSGKWKLMHLSNKFPETKRFNFNTSESKLYFYKIMYLNLASHFSSHRFLNFSMFSGVEPSPEGISLQALVTQAHLTTLELDLGIWVSLGHCLSENKLSFPDLSQSLSKKNTKKNFLFGLRPI